MEVECSNRRECVDEHHHLVPPSLARRLISLYSPETLSNRYLGHIRGFISRLESPRRWRGTRSISLQPPLSYVRAIYPAFTCVAHTKSEMASTWRSSSSKSSRRRAGEWMDRLPLPLTPWFYCVVARDAINSRGFTVPWKSAERPSANIIHGTRPLFLRVTFPICGRIADGRIQLGRNRAEEIVADRRGWVIH